MKIVLALASTLFVGAVSMVGATSSYGQLDSANPDGEESEDIDPNMASFIDDLEFACPEEVVQLAACYSNDADALVACSNCAWSNFNAEGESVCDDMDAIIDATAAACVDNGSCNDDCARAQRDVNLCAKFRLCGGAMVLPTSEA